MDEEDDDNEVEDGEADDSFTFERSEKKAILTSSIRKYIVPKINFDATSYTQLIDWENPGMTEPPLTLSMTDAQITAFKTSPFDVPHYPCHTQAVERGVSLVSEASSKVWPKSKGWVHQAKDSCQERIEKVCHQERFFPQS